ncbi:MAG: diguanylate cyclase [Planctomycetota bacterium]|jgi:diguanylate cyclase (GGDEF)-like protein/putative nucleotidyltransferase with HDIG domain
MQEKEIVDRPTAIVAISCDTTVRAAAVKMFTNRIGCLIVNDNDGRFAGIVSERDIVARAVASSIDMERTAITEIMTPRVVSCPAGTPMSKAREIMATNGIRHLPVVDNGAVVGIFSIRDVMGQQLLEDRAAAEEVAMLSNCLKSIELNEAAETVTKEVPKLFQAAKCVLCLHKHDSNRQDSMEPQLASYNRCVCPRENIRHLADNVGLLDKSGYFCDSIPYICEKAGAAGPRLILPLEISGLQATPGQDLSGYLCMCGLANWTTLNKELTSYKAKLTRGILTSHLTNANLYHQARLTSMTDVLTATGSRRLLEDKLQSEYARSKRYKCPFSVAIMDLDNFKTINDVLGHATGDETLKKLAACMRQEKRAPDILARYGGDEFVIVMPETRAKDAVRLLERIREKVQKIDVAENVSMTISCGIAQSLPAKDDSSTDVVRRADLALYEAKSAGRNCVKVWNKSMSKALDASDIEIEKIKQLKRRIAGMSQQAEKTFVQSIWGLVQALEAKDPYAKKHSENVVQYSLRIAERMNVGPRQLEVIRRAAMIHDIGRIGIPDAILFKPSRLTPHERNIIEQHPLIAVRILEKMSFLEQEVTIVRAHHEKWNGHGYPDRLANTSIPLGARIMAVADAFDALTSNRSYHKSRTPAEAARILVDSSGYDFDPEIVEIMISWLKQVSDRLGGIDRLTTDDLLDSKTSFDDNATLEPAGACATGD